MASTDFDGLEGIGVASLWKVIYVASGQSPVGPDISNAGPVSCFLAISVEAAGVVCTRVDSYIKIKGNISEENIFYRY